MDKKLISSRRTRSARQVRIQAEYDRDSFPLISLGEGTYSSLGLKFRGT